MHFITCTQRQWKKCIYQMQFLPSVIPPPPPPLFFFFFFFCPSLNHLMWNFMKKTLKLTMFVHCWSQKHSPQHAVLFISYICLANSVSSFFSFFFLFSCLGFGTCVLDKKYRNRIVRVQTFTHKKKLQLYYK